MSVEDPYRLAAAALVFAVQIPIQRAILARDRTHAPVRVLAFGSAAPHRASPSRVAGETR